MFSLFVLNINLFYCVSYYGGNLEEKADAFTKFYCKIFACQNQYQDISQMYWNLPLFQCNK